MNQTSAGTDGKLSDPIYCRNCGAEMQPTAKFCPECGAEGGEVGADGDNGLVKGVGVVSAIVSLIFLPILFGPVAMFCGYLLYDRGEEQWGRNLGVGGFFAMIVGFLLSLVVLGAV